MSASCATQFRGIVVNSETLLSLLTIRGTVVCGSCHSLLPSCTINKLVHTAAAWIQTATSEVYKQCVGLL